MRVFLAVLVVEVHKELYLIHQLHIFVLYAELYTLIYLEFHVFLYLLYLCLIKAES